jgi:hypothetical protein
MIILRPGSNFTGNGVLKGTLVAYYAAGEPLWETVENWSSDKARQRAAKDLAATTGITEDRALALGEGQRGGGDDVD